MIAQISDALYLQMYDTNHLHCPCTYHSNFLSSLLYKFGTISGTKYSSHWFISCIGVIGILEGYKTWQVITYVTVERATQCTKCFLFVRFFHENMINTGFRKLGDTSRQRYIRQIPVWHHCGHVRYYTFISVFYKLNIHVSSQNGVFLSSSLVNVVSNDDTKWDTFPPGCRYIPPKVYEIPFYLNSIKSPSNSHFEQSNVFINIKSFIITPFNRELCV